MQIFPIELLDLVSAHVDEPSDLLSFALTNRALKHVIIPHQLDYRYIRCDLRRRYVWKHLCKNPLLASRIRTLEIIHENPDSAETCDPENPGDPIIPRTPTGRKDKDFSHPIQKYFIPAIRKMVNLRILRWFTKLLFEELYLALHESHLSLTGLEVQCGGLGYVTHRPLAHLEVWPKFYNLTSFSYSIRLWSSWFNAEHDAQRREAFMTLLHKNCPNLEELQLDLNNHVENTLQGLFRNVEWPQLKRLNVPPIILHQDHISFFASHPNLQSLCISEPFPGVVDLRFDYTALRGLRSLELDRPPQLALPIATNLTSLSFEIEPLESDFPFPYRPTQTRPPDISNDHLNIVQVCNNLRHLVVRSHTPHSKPLTTLLRVVPQTLERLAYLDLANRVTDFALDGDIFEQPQDLALLKRLINLTHLGRIHVVDNDFPTNSRAVQAILRVSSAAQNLRFVAWKSLLKPDSWAHIIRDNQGHVLTHQTIYEGKCRDDVEFDRWGGHYRGAKPVEHRPTMEGGDAFSEPDTEDEYSDYQKENSEDDDPSE